MDKIVDLSEGIDGRNDVVVQGGQLLGSSSLALVSVIVCRMLDYHAIHGALFTMNAPRYITIARRGGATIMKLFVIDYYFSAPAHKCVACEFIIVQNSGKLINS